MTIQQHAPLVSVLIPVYNGTEFLDAAIQSVLNSTYQNVEIILVDDGSTDLSKHKCQAYEKMHEHIHFFGFRKNKGMTRCLNFGVKKAKGKYIARLNQDDIMTPHRLQKQVDFLENHPDYVIVGGAIQLFTELKPRYDVIKFPKTDTQIRDQWLYLSPYSDPTVMYRKDIWMKTEGYNQYFWPADDVHMWYQLGQYGKMANLQSILTKVRWHEHCGSIMSHKRQMIKTWMVHQWASEFITESTIVHKIFWFGQLLAGFIFPPKFNWWIYRITRHMQNWYLSTRKHAKRYRQHVNQRILPIFAWSTSQ